MAMERGTVLADDRDIGGADGPQDEPFLQRWARRKADAVNTTADDTQPEGPGVDTASLQHPSPASTPAPEDSSDSDEIDLSTLPDIDSMSAESDFSVFMQNGIPDELRKRALQRLWRLDPAFGHIDGLLEYGEDYSGNGLVAEAVNTIYKVGKGMVTDEEEEAERLAAAEAEENADAEAVDATGEEEAPAIAAKDGPGDGTPPPQPNARDAAASDDSANAETVKLAATPRSAAPKR